MNEKKNDFSQGSIIKNILGLAVPMTLAQLINVLYNIVDRIYIGRIAENATLSLTGLGLCLPIISVVMAFANLYGMGGAPLCSIERGRGNDAEAEKIMGNSFVLMVITGIILTVAGLVFKKPLLYLFGASDSTYPFADKYITIYLMGNLFVMTGLGMNAFINSQGFGKIGMETVLLGAVSNIILDPVFIFLFDMGVQGAALATVISQFLSAVWIMRFLTGKQTILKLRLSSLALDGRRVIKIVGLGMSGFAMSITNSISQVVYNATLQQFGGDLYVGVMTIINSVREIITMPVNGLTQGSQPVMGYNYGAGKYGRVKQSILFMSAVSILYTTGMWYLIHTFPGFFIRIFNRDPDIIAAGIPAMKVYYFGFFFMSLQFAGQAVFVALGKAKYAVFFSIFRKIVIVMPLALILPHLFGLGTTGVFMAEPISNFIGGVACYVTMLVTVWPELRKAPEAARSAGAGADTIQKNDTVPGEGTVPKADTSQESEMNWREDAAPGGNGLKGETVPGAEPFSDKETAQEEKAEPRLVPDDGTVPKADAPQENETGPGKDAAPGANAVQEQENKSGRRKRRRGRKDPGQE